MQQSPTFKWLNQHVSPGGTPVGYISGCLETLELSAWILKVRVHNNWSTRLALRSDKANIGLHVAFKRCCHADVISRADSLFSLLFVPFHTPNEWDAKDLISVRTVQREFIHSSMTNTVCAITPSEPLLPTYKLFGKTGETDSFQVLSPHFPTFSKRVLFRTPRVGSQDSTRALSLVQGPGWNREKFNLKGAKSASKNCPFTTAKSPPSTSPGTIMRGQTKTRWTYWA